MAWSIVGVGSVVEVTVTSHTLTEPAGCAAGDLLVACIGSRIASTTSITLPSGWTRVTEQKINNVVLGTTGQASACIAYIIRGASAPALGFTHPVTPNVARGQIVAYRENTAGNGISFDAFGGGQTATAVTAISIASSVTTTAAGDLLVGTVAGGSASTYTAFKTANAPSTASGATNTSSAPSTTTWTERADASSATGADIGLSIFDAVKTATGAGGAITATASVSSGHAVLMAAFRTLPIIADAWNSSDRTYTVTLSDSDKTATHTPAATGGIRSSTERTNGAAGKYYAEWVATTIGASSQFALKSKTSDIAAPGTESFRYLNSGSVFVSGTQVASIGAVAAGDIVCVAWDSGTERFWFRKNSGLWNNDASADPATGTNGLDASALPNTSFCLYWAGVTAAVTTLRTKLADYTQTIPSGFTSWMGETPNAWNVNDKSANITLSASDKTATVSSTTAAGVRSAQTYANGTAGKYYAEFVLNASRTTAFGVSPTSNTLVAATSTAYVNGISGGIVINGVASGIGVSTPAASDILCVAWDAGVERIWFRKNADNWNNSATASPATDTEGVDFSIAAASQHALWMYATGTTGYGGTLRTELADYTQAIPSGFTSWMGETPTSGGVTVNAVGVSAGSAVGTATVDTVAGVSFEAVGVAAGSAVGTVSIAGKANLTATGVSAGSAVGTPAVDARTNISTLATGQAAVSVAGTVSVVAKANVSVAAVSVSAGAAVGTAGVSSSGAVSVSATSVAVATAVGDVSLVGKANVTITGVAAAALAGSPSVSGKAAVTATGVSAAAQTGVASVSTTQVVTVTPTGQTTTALTGSTSVAVGGGVSITPASVAAAALAGTAAVSAVQHVTVAATGHTTTALVGSPSVSGGVAVSATGHAVTALTGTASVTTRQTAIVSATGVAATALTGGVSISTAGSVSLTSTGVTGTALAGTAVATAKQVVAVAAAGQAVTALAGNVLVSGSVSVMPAGQAVASDDGVATVTTTSAAINVTVAAIGHAVQAEVGAVTVTTVALRGMDVWTGTAWAPKPAKVWTGSAWVTKPVKLWNGSSWS